MPKFMLVFVALMMLFVVMIVSVTKNKTKLTDYEAINNLIVSERLYRVSHRDEKLAECYAEKFIRVGRAAALNLSSVNILPNLQLKILM